MKRRWVVRGLAMALLVALFVTGRMQIWMVLFAGGVLAAIGWGRLYCGWLCPINTAMLLTSPTGKRRRPVPRWARHWLVRAAILVLMVAAFAIGARTGRRLPVLPFLMTVGVVLSLFYVPALWHRYLCPFGTILTCTGRLARRHHRVDPDGCVSCGLCLKACPGEAMGIDEQSGRAVIDKSHCLECGSCAEVCPKQVIAYR